MAHLYRNCQQTLEPSGKCCSACWARKSCFYRLQIGLASVIGVLTLTWMIYASPRQELLLKPIHAQTIAVFDKFVVSEACEMVTGESACDCRACRNGKIFKMGDCAERQLNSAKNVITCLIRKGTSKLQAALS